MTQGFPFTVGQVIGPSPWVEVTQQMTDGFGVATLDRDPMHMDREWALVNSPFGRTIAYGFQTVSLLTHLMYQAMGTRKLDDPQQFGSFVNYGIEKLRLVEPVYCDARVRGSFTLQSFVTDKKERQIATFGCVIENEGSGRPALVGEWLSIWLPPKTRLVD